jgi:hypothetical protein
MHFFDKFKMTRHFYTARKAEKRIFLSPDAVDAVVCAPDDGWKYHPKHVEQFPDINKLCDVATCWIYGYIGILLGVHPVLHISRIKVKDQDQIRVNTYHKYQMVMG